jgi:predicted fused transcriptional regulator/phosphomethylpyrimidine kinase/predicted transcriptional regulator
MLIRLGITRLSMIPLEIARECFLSPLRSEIAAALRRRGWSQGEIAKVLGVTQVAVSKLLREARKGRLREVGIDDLEAELLVAAAVDLTEKGELELASALLHRYWLLVSASGGACDAHRRMGWALLECAACARALHPKLAPAKAVALADLERAVLLAELSPNLAALAPEVLVNVARAAPGAVSLRDVAAVPGRLARVGGRLVARRRPRFGASRHLAEVLLASGYAACINVKYNKDVERALEELGFEKFVFSSERYRGPNPAAAAVREARERGELPRVAVDLGGRGVEPVTYIFGGSAVEVVLAAERVARLVRSWGG